MKSKLIISLLLTPALMTGSILIEPATTHAIFGVGDTVVVVGDTAPTTFIQTAKQVITAVSTGLSWVANKADFVNTYVLQPLAFAMSGNLLKLITAKAVDFVIGKTNGTGKPQFVTNLAQHKQGIGDAQAYAFLVQFGKNSNSPFRSAIQTQLRRDYLQDTSLDGFFNRNRSTLDSVSPNINKFLAGDFSQGGTRAWLALTTQSQNNPYTFYYDSQKKMAVMVNSAIDNRLEELRWNQGFLSWCGPKDASSDATKLEEAKVTTQKSAATNADELQEVTVTAARMGAAQAGDPCTKDGVPGEIKTPGSVIKAALDKALGSSQDKLANMGSTGKEIQGILGSLGKIMSTVSFAQALMDSGNSGGLAGAAQASSGSASALDQYNKQDGFLGSNVNNVYANAPSIPSESKTTDIEARLPRYQTAWNIIQGSANAAQAAVTDLSICTNPTTLATAQDAKAVVAGVTANAADALAAVSAANAQITIIRNMESQGVDPQSSTYLNAVQILQSMPPSEAEVLIAEQEAVVTPTVSGDVNSQQFGAVATPAGSLNAVGGSIVDRMGLITTNAKALKLSACGT